MEGNLSPGLIADVTVSRSETFRLEMNLAIGPGETAALLGPNGSGKSTAVAAISGLLPIESGRIILDGVVLDDPVADVLVPASERDIGVVFQDYLLFPHMTVLENVAFGLRSRRVDKEEATERSKAWLADLGLEGLEKRKPLDLSGGQAQRVALARALVTEPSLLLLDEPLSALDVTTRSELRHTLAEHLDAFEGPRLLITHDPVEAFLLADEIHIIEEGAVSQSGTADDIRLRPRTRYAADLAGSNLLRGIASDGFVRVGEQILHTAEEDASGPVLVTIHPTAVSVHNQEPGGSPRNTWETSVERVEVIGARARMRTGPPLPLTVEITDTARKELGVGPGDRVWVAVKATEIGIDPDT